jgi:hypothetical protein
LLIGADLRGRALASVLDQTFVFGWSPRKSRNSFGPDTNLRFRAMGPSLRELAEAEKEIRMLGEMIAAAETRLAVALANVEGDEEPTAAEA